MLFCGTLVVPLGGEPEESEYSPAGSIVIDGDVDAEVGGVWVGDGDLQDEFADAVELTQECFTIKKPRVRKLLWFA